MVGEAERRTRFGYALKQALDARGVSERQLAMRLGVDPRKVAQWRTGKVLPDIYQTLALAELLRVDERLFRDPPPVPKPPAYPIEDYLLGAVDEGVRRGLQDEGPAPQVDDERDEPPSRPPR